MKLYILVREDINASIGKLMVHIGHISTDVGRWYPKYDAVYEWYEYYDQTKIILSIKDIAEISKFHQLAKENKLLYFSVSDAGFTKEIEKGTVIMCGILCKDKEAEKIGLKKLRLFKR